MTFFRLASVIIFQLKKQKQRTGSGCLLKCPLKSKNVRLLLYNLLDMTFVPSIESYQTMSKMLIVVWFI